jgi:flagellar basal-body rod modification protein FlgD
MDIAATAATGSSGTLSAISSGAQLDQGDFLMLLITELMNQDPLEPLDDRDFIAQMAQLNTLDQTVSLNENIQTLQMLQSASLVGRTIEAIGPNGESVEGTVTEVWFLDSEPYITIDDEVVVSLDRVVRIA